MNNHLLLCEHCGHYCEAPRRPDMPGFTFGPITCDTCGKTATLVKASHGVGTTIGGYIVVYDYDLPAR